MTTPCEADPDLWHPDGTSDSATRASKEAAYAPAVTICNTECPEDVRAACLQAALDHETRGSRHGVWGGTTPEERTEIATRLGLTPPPVKVAPVCPTCGRADLPHAARHQKTCADQAKAADVYLRTGSIAEVAAAVDCSSEWARKLLRRANVKGGIIHDGRAL